MGIVARRSSVTGSRRNIVLAWLLLAAAAGATGGAQGVGLYFVAAALDISRDTWWAAALLLVFVILGAIVGRPPIQIDRETPRAWLRYRDWRTAALNGAALGSGAVTRIGFLSYFVAFGAAFLAGGAVAAIAVGAVYGLTRILLTAVLQPSRRNRKFGLATDGIVRLQPYAASADRLGALGLSLLLLGSSISLEAS